jgi:acetylornithine deacetylase
VLLCGKQRRLRQSGMDLFALTRTLIDIPSTTGAEGEVGHFVSSYLESLGYKLERQDVGEDRANIFATTSARPRVVLSTHLDTVPPYYSSSEDDQYLYGRGACDAKGIIAAQIAAAENLRADDVSDVGLLFVVDEELGSAGARAANEHPFATSSEYLINGEPTQNKLARGTKGSLRVRISAEGRSAHSAYPECGESAIDKLLDVLADIRTAKWPADEFFGETTVNIGTIEGGVRSNVIPAHAEADLQIRLAAPSATVKALLDNIATGRSQVEYLSLVEPVRMVTIDGVETCVVRFATDVPHLTNWGAPLLLGPGSILDAHTENERISKAELLDAVQIYTRLIRALLARTRDA